MAVYKVGILIITVLFSGLIAGLLFGYACSVNAGLHQLPDAAYINAMQSINIKIQNPYFLLVFMSLPLLFPLTTWLYYNTGQPPVFYLLLAAAVMYLAGVLGITALGNIPLNNQLAAADILKENPATLAEIRANFENAWVKFHLIRTIAAILSFLLAVIAAVKYHA